MQLIAQEIKLPTLYTVPPDAIEARDKMLMDSEHIQHVETATAAEVEHHFAQPFDGGGATFEAVVASLEDGLH